MNPLPELPLHGRYRVTRVPEGLCVTYPVSILGFFLISLWLLGFCLVLVVSTRLAPSSIATLKTLTLAWAATIPLGSLLLAANFRHPLVLRNDGQVARGPLSVPAREVKRRGDWLNLGRAQIWMPVLRRDLDWLEACLSVLARRQAADVPLEVPERATADYSESGASGLFLWLSLASLLGVAGWTAWTVAQHGSPAFPYWSKLWTVGGGVATLLLLTGMSGRNTVALSAFLYAALIFAWNANVVADPTATTRNFRVLARFESGRPNPGVENHFLELEVPAHLAAFRFVALSGRGGPGRSGQFQDGRRSGGTALAANATGLARSTAALESARAPEYGP